jgi:hypothetical protein
MCRVLHSQVDGLWQLCQFEAGLHGDVSKACSLFTEPEVSRGGSIAEVPEWITS